MMMSAKPSGYHTLQEILSQPACWSECLPHLVSSTAFEAAASLNGPGITWIFIGCGTSYYLAQAASATFNHFRLSAQAVAASEILMYPELTLHQGKSYVAVVISRSGRTSEAIRAARLIARDYNVPTVGVTCSAGQPLERECNLVLTLTGADEQSTVMTRSFTAMLLSLQLLGAKIVRQTIFYEFLLSLPEKVQPLIDKHASNVEKFACGRRFADFVFLAQGPLFGIASECMLKVMEASSSYAQVFHTLEFRHGPKSIIGPDTLITFLISQSSRDAEVEVLKEMKALGAATFVVANQLGDAARFADVAIELSLGAPEFARPAAFVIWSQLYGAHYGINKGLDPDAPRNLTRVVELVGEGL